VHVIVLAAGFSRRLGHPKQLVIYEGETLIRRAARIAGEVGEVVVVTTPQFADIEFPSTAVVINETPEEGMASSIRAGVAACDDDVLITLCDQPRVTADHLRALIAANAPIAATAYSGTLGVPAYFARLFRDELLALRGDHGAKRIIEAHQDLVAAIPFADAAFDVD
jgi:molybdenum cofactor cytidylyltransferase